MRKIAKISLKNPNSVKDQARFDKEIAQFNKCFTKINDFNTKLNIFNPEYCQILKKNNNMWST